MKNVFELITYNKHKLAFYYLSIFVAASLNEGRFSRAQKRDGVARVIDAS